MALVGIDRIVVDPVGRTERRPAVGAAGEHHVRAVTAERTNAGYHVNVVVSRAAGAVHSNEDLARQSTGIHRAAENQATAHIDCCDLIKRWRHTRILGVARTDAPEAATGIATANE